MVAEQVSAKGHAVWTEKWRRVCWGQRLSYWQGYLLWWWVTNALRFCVVSRLLQPPGTRCEDQVLPPSASKCSPHPLPWQLSLHFTGWVGPSSKVNEESQGCGSSQSSMAHLHPPWMTAPSSWPHLQGGDALISPRPLAKTPHVYPGGDGTEWHGDQQGGQTLRSAAEGYEMETWSKRDRG